MKVNPSRTINELVTALSFAADIEGNKKNYHSWRVAVFSVKIAQRIRPQQLKNIFYAALMHDIGGVGFPFHIIHYLVRTDEASQNILLSHPIIGAQLTADIPGLSSAAKLILDHHEWINGHGYPRAKTKKDIPPGSQIIRIADACDIFLQSGRSPKIKELRKKLSLNIDKEYTNRLFCCLGNMLEEDNFFAQISRRENTPEIFREIGKRGGLIHIPLKIDAIGAALNVTAEISDMKHPYTYGHSMRVSHYALNIALAMHLKHDDVTRIKWAALLHDIGKISISRNILDKPRRLKPKETRAIKKHALLTEEIMGMMPSLKEITPLAGDHHEYFDGSGYPHGLRGEEIPLGARIVTVCDAFDAMTSNRPYRNAMSLQSAYQRIKKLSGTQFDPRVVKAALPIFRKLAL